MKRFVSLSRLVFVVPLLLALVPAPASADATAGPGAYTALSPVRVIDTRSGLSVPGRGAISISFPPAAVPAGATAVAVNVTVTGGSQPGYASLYPLGGSSATSVLNWTAGQTVANLSVVALGWGGQLSLFNGSYGAADFVVDLQGYFAAPSGTAGQLVSVSPFRLADTRPASGSPYAGLTLGSGSILNLDVTGVGGIPASGVSAVVLNVTSTGSTANGYFTLWPAGYAQPLASNLNFSAGDTKANRVIVRVGSGGLVSLYNRFGAVNAVVDVSGWFTDSSGYYGQGAWFTPIQPVRLLDTRTASLPLGPGGVVTVQAAGVGGISSAALSTVLNVTATNTTGGSYLTVFSGGSVPNVSDVNWDPSDVNSNAVVAQLSSGGTQLVYNAYGWTDVVVDAFGFFTRSAAPYTPPYTPPPYIPPTPGVGLWASISPSALPADGSSKATLTVSVRDSSNNALVGDPVLLTPSGTCGSLSATSGYTGAGGLFSPTYTASSTAGSCTIAVAEAHYGYTTAVSVNQTVVPNLVAMAGGNLPADTYSTLQLAATVTAAAAPHDPVVGDTVSFSLSGYPAGACGTLSAYSAATTGGGIAYTTYRASSVQGFCNVTATETVKGGSVSAQVVQTANPRRTDNVVQLAASPGTVPADGHTTSLVSATAATASAAPIAGDLVAFSLGSGCGSVSPGYAYTNSSGVATVTYTAATASGPCTVTAVESAGAATDDLAITQSVAPNLVSVSASPTLVKANGTSTSTITVLDTTATGTPDAGDSITLDLAGTCGTLSASSGTADVYGKLIVTYTSSGAIGFCTVRAQAGGGLGTVLITQTAS